MAERVWTLAAGLAAAIAALPGGAYGQESARPPNFLLLTLDTLRADRLGCYGYRKASTPRLDRLASEGARFAQAVSPVPLTLPAHATILTGLFPMGHGVRDNGTFRLAPEKTTLAEILRDRGYQTAAFVSSFVVDSRFGLAEGFDVYVDFDDDPGASRRATRVLSEVQRRGGDTAERALAWLSQPRRAPFFLWVHLYDPHAPFDPPEPYRSAFAGRPYDGEIAYTDAVVGQILDRLESLGISEKTLVMVLGDHGESLGEHGEDYHSWFVYDSVLMVPFLARMAGRIQPGRVIGEQVRLADVAPTALGLLGVRHEAQPAMQGTSLASWLTGQGTRSELPAYAESLVPRLQFGWAELKAIRARGFKYVEAPRPELYDLKTDPGETRNLMLNAKSMARELRAELQELEKRFRVAEEPEPRGETIDEETARKLQSLGYVASARAASDPQLARIDPKDRIAVYRRFNEDLSRATEALDADRPDEAIRLLKPLAQEAPGNSRIHNQLGQAYLEKRDYRRAIGEFEVVLGIAPQFWQARADLAKTLVLVGEPGRAVKLLEEGLADQPRNAVLLFNLGFAHHRQEKFAAALEAYRKARKVEKNYPQLLSNISMLYLQTGQAGAAVARLEELVREEPTNSLAWNNLGLARVQAGRLDEAGLAFKTAVDLAHENVVFGKNLALWYQRVGKTDEAEAELRRLKALEGKSPRPR